MEECTWRSAEQKGVWSQVKSVGQGKVSGTELRAEDDGVLSEFWRKELEFWRLGCPLTSTPPSEMQHPDAGLERIGLNLIKSNSTVHIHLAAPGCL